MDGIKRAWIYCCIDAPEDSHGQLKGQHEALMSYAGQLGFDVIGESQDIGGGQDIDRNGLKSVLEAACAAKMDVLLIMNISRISNVMNQAVDIVHRLNNRGIKIYSPLSGEILTAIPSGKLESYIRGRNIKRL